MVDMGKSSSNNVALEKRPGCQVSFTFYGNIIRDWVLDMRKAEPPEVSTEPGDFFSSGEFRELSGFFGECFWNIPAARHLYKLSNAWDAT